MKSECWSCGNYARMPLSDRHWCHECENEYERLARRKVEIIDDLLDEILDGEPM